MDIYVYDGFELIDVVDIWASLRWRRMYRGAGEFELHVPDTLEHINLFTPGRHINRPDRKETGLIESITLSRGDMTVSGRFLSAWLYDGIIEKTYSANEEMAASIRAWVQAYIIPEHTGLILGDTVSGTPKQRFQTSYKNIGENIEKFARAAGIGFYIEKDFSNQRYLFHLYKGKDRSAAQSENNRVFFSNEYANLDDPKYAYDMQEYRNYAVVLGEGEGEARERVIVDRRKSGETKRAMYVNAASSKLEDGMTLAEYRQTLTDLGNVKLDEKTVEETFEGEAAEVPDFVYMEDYDIGDIVTVEYEPWEKGMFQQITEVEEVYEGASAEITPVFGDPAPEKLDLEDLI